MLAQLIEFSLKNRLIVLTLTGLLALTGIISALRLPIDAVPDLTNVQVQIVTKAGSLSPIEVERYVTYPIESSMSGLPQVEELRSISRLGISVVTIVFREGTDLYWARQLVSQRLVAAQANIPAGFAQPELGPLTTALGEILQFQLKGDGYSPMELRTMLEWDISPKLREVSGVTEVNTIGGQYKTYQIRPNPDRMHAQGISLEELISRLEANNLTAGGGYSIQGDQQRFIQGQALIQNEKDIESIVLRGNPGETSLLVHDVATVEIGPMMRQGAATRDGKGEAVIGMTMMLVGENSRVVVERIKERIADIQKTLPKGVELDIVYDRAQLINRTLSTVMRNLAEGGALVIVVLLIMLGSIRAGIIVALAIPLSMMFATNLMLSVGVTASLMSLGAIDFGMIVDSSVIMVENCLHRLSHAKPGDDRTAIIRDAAIEVRKPTMFGELIIAVVYLPILLLEGTEGKLFRPMAITVLFALAGSLVLSMTFMPAMASLALPKNIKDEEVWLVKLVKRIYQPVVQWAIKNPVVTCMIGIVVFLASIPVARNLGGEFMPKLSEGDILIEVVRLPSATLEDSIPLTTKIEKMMLELPEVKTVMCKTGRPEIANDVMGVHQTDVWVILKHGDGHSQQIDREALIKKMSERMQTIPGIAFGFSQPIEMRVDELVAGVKADVAVLIYGDDMFELGRLAKQVERTLRGIKGAADVKADYQANLRTLRIEVRRDALARYGVDAKRVMDLVQSLGDYKVGEVFQGRIRFPILVHLPEEWRGDIEKIGQLPVVSASGDPIPLRELTTIAVEETPPAVEHEWIRRRTFVQANVRGTDVASFVNAAQEAVKKEVSLPAGYEIRWGGDFENLQSASLRLAIITPIVLFIILMLLHTTFRSMSLALLIYLAVPMAASGGVFALWLRGMPFSISAGVGFIALFGVAVLNGLVWVSAAEVRRREMSDMREVSRLTALSRLRPILMTAMVASLGFLPMSISHGDGAEIQRPLATVVIGGLITSTLLTTIVLPAIYPWVARFLKSHGDIEPDKELVASH